MSWRNRAGRATLLGLAAVALAVGSAVAGALPLAGAAGAAPGSTDTLLVRLAGPAGCPRPVAIHVRPDTVTFGGRLEIALDFPAGTRAPRADDVVSRAGEVIWDGERGSGRDGAGRAPPEWPRPAGGPRLVGTARVCQLGPLRIAWEGGDGPVSTLVHGRPALPEGAPPAPVRDPRSLGWRLGWLALLAGLAALAGGLAWRLRRRRRMPLSRDAPLSPPPHLRAALALWDLHEAQLPARGEGRRFLDRLSGDIRRFLEDRYGVRAGQSTPGEIAAGLRGRGHEAALAARAATLLQRCDTRRYAPESVAASACGDLFAQAVALVDAGCWPARFTPVPPELAVAGEAAWTRLLAVAPPPGGRGRV